MNEARLAQLLAFLEEDPDDPFTSYAIATEYLKSDKKKARYYFEILLQKHPDYVATYYHAAHLYWDLNLHREAVQTFEQGITKAREQQDHLALRELRSAYEQYQFEVDDD
jgi:tetratricopeptide (TPR) repeat protein